MSDAHPEVVVKTTAFLTGRGPVTAAHYRALLNSRLVPGPEVHAPARLPQVPDRAEVVLDVGDWDTFDAKHDEWELRATWTAE